jgi:predicted RNase H-like HicB family nuclease
VPANLKEAITLMLDYRREESRRALPPEAVQELVTVG